MCMAKMQLLLDAWDTGYFELGEAFEGLEDADVWRRAHPRLLSIGENCAHMAYWEALRFTRPDLSKPTFADLPVQSKLLAPDAYYYTGTVENPVVLDMSAQEVLSEARRIHEAARDAVARLDPSPEDPLLAHEGWTWGPTLQYMIIHVGYHTGQIYSVRHLMGHETKDN